MNIGILDIHGSTEEHFAAIKKAGAHAVLVKNEDDLKKVRGLIIPGGESTTIGKLLRRFGLREAIIKRAREGMPIFGTCAGSILMAKKIIGKQVKGCLVDNLGIMDITVSRNAYGRQINSFETEIKFDFGEFGALKGLWKKIPAVFIRAPKIVDIGGNAKVLAKYENEIVAVREQNMLALMFHPELTDDLSVHEYFIKMCG